MTAWRSACASRSLGLLLALCCLGACVSAQAAAEQPPPPPPEPPANNPEPPPPAAQPDPAFSPPPSVLLHPVTQRLDSLISKGVLNAADPSISRLSLHSMMLRSLVMDVLPDPSHYIHASMASVQAQTAVEYNTASHPTSWSIVLEPVPPAEFTHVWTSYEPVDATGQPIDGAGVILRLHCDVDLLLQRWDTIWNVLVMPEEDQATLGATVQAEIVTTAASGQMMLNLSYASGSSSG